MNKILAIIPARGGSKGVKNKNIKKINKKPLIYWTINEAKKSKKITKIIISTDSNNIKKISLKYNQTLTRTITGTLMQTLIRALL